MWLDPCSRLVSPVLLYGAYGAVDADLSVIASVFIER